MKLKKNLWRNKVSQELNEKLEKLNEKIDKILEIQHDTNIRVERIDTTTNTNTKVLEEHQRRSLANEKRLNILEGFHKGLGVLIVLLGIAFYLQRLGLF